MTTNKSIKDSQIIYGFATSLYPEDGKEKARLQLQGERDYKTKIAVHKTFVNLVHFLDTCSSKLLGTEKKWAKLNVISDSPSLFEKIAALIEKIIHFIKKGSWIEVHYKPKTILVNVNSLCKRTTLSREQILSSSPEKLAALLASPESIVWKYGTLDNNLFPHVLFINMKSRPDRLESFQQHLRAIGAELKYEVVDAVIGKDLLPEEIEKMSKSDFAKRTSGDDRQGRLGCFKSHLKALQQAKENQWEEVLIAEDDVRFIPNYFSSQYAAQAKKELPNDWGILFLGHHDAEKKKAKSFSDHLIQPGLPYDCHSYIVHSRMYDHLIQLLEKELQKGPAEMRALDVVIGEELPRTGKVFACKDNIAIQNEGMSSILSKYTQGNYRNDLRRFHRILSPRAADSSHTADGLPIMPPLLAGTLYQMMYHVAQLFDKYKIQYVIDGGTALGAERHKGLIPHDDDIDLQLFPGEEQKLKNLELQKELKQVGLEIVEHWVGAKVCAIQDHPLGWPHNKDGYRFKTPNIDLFFSEQELRDGDEVHFYKSKKVKEFWPNMFIKKSEIYQEDGTLKEVEFGPIKVKAIAKQKEYCFRCYGPDCLGEAYVQYDHLRERGLTKKPVVITDFAPPPFKQWHGLALIPGIQ